MTIMVVQTILSFNRRAMLYRHVRQANLAVLKTDKRCYNSIACHWKYSDELRDYNNVQILDKKKEPS